MIKMSLISGYDPVNQYEVLQKIDLQNGDIVSWDYELNLGEPHRLNIEFSTKFARYEYIQSRTDFGIRLQTDTLDLAFVFLDREATDYGKVKVSLISGSYKLQQSPIINYNQYYSGSLSGFLGTLDPNEFEFVLIDGSDTDVKIQTGALTNYEAMVEAIKYKEFFDWLEVGIYKTGTKFKNRILFGDFRNIENRYNAQPNIYPQLKPIEATMFNQIDNDDLNKATILSYQRIENVPKFSHVLAYLNSATNNSPNNVIELEKGASYENPLYPIETINGINYVRANQTAIYPTRIKVYPVLDSASIEDQTGTEDLTVEISAEMAYKKTIAYIQANKPTTYYKYNLGLKKLTLPGVPVKVKFKDTIQLIDGTVIETINVDETQIPTQYIGDGGDIIF